MPSDAQKDVDPSLLRRQMAALYPLLYYSKLVAQQTGAPVKIVMTVTNVFYEDKVPLQFLINGESDLTKLLTTFADARGMHSNLTSTKVKEFITTAVSEIVNTAPPETDNLPKTLTEKLAAAKNILQDARRANFQSFSIGEAVFDLSQEDAVQKIGAYVLEQPKLKSALDGFLKDLATLEKIALQSTPAWVSAICDKMTFLQSFKDSKPLASFSNTLKIHAETIDPDAAPASDNLVQQEVLQAIKTAFANGKIPSQSEINRSVILANAAMGVATAAPVTKITAPAQAHQAITSAPARGPGADAFDVEFEATTYDTPKFLELLVKTLQGVKDHASKLPIIREEYSRRLGKLRDRVYSGGQDSYLIVALNQAMSSLDNVNQSVKNLNDDIDVAIDFTINFAAEFRDRTQIVLGAMRQNYPTGMPPEEKARYESGSAEQIAYLASKLSTPYDEASKILEQERASAASAVQDSAPARSSWRSLLFGAPSGHGRFLS